jgi:hypothetical protein
MYLADMGVVMGSAARDMLDSEGLDPTLADRRAISAIAT